MTSPARLQELISKGLQELNFPADPASLYDPIVYMLALGGKRIRPVLLMMSAELFDSAAENALKPALGIEVFHNFTLLHDDIMDNAPLRRTKQTVHEKWNSNIAILSGDAMFVKSCELMMQVPDKILRPVLEVFYKTALEVCEGQQFDMDFECDSSVSLNRYLEMIRLKTAVLLGCSLKVGALIGGADEITSQHLYDFGVNLGLAFQVQDDILDVYAIADKFGKQVGGDILANKKTFLLLTALAQSNAEQKKELDKWIAVTSVSAEQSEQKIKAVTAIYDTLKVRELAEQKMQEFYDKAFRHMNSVNVDESKKENLKQLASDLMVRQQ